MTLLLLDVMGCMVCGCILSAKWLTCAKTWNVLTEFGLLTSTGYVSSPASHSTNSDERHLIIDCLRRLVVTIRSASSHSQSIEVASILAILIGLIGLIVLREGLN